MSWPRHPPCSGSRCPGSMPVPHLMAYKHVHLPTRANDDGGLDGCCTITTYCGTPRPRSRPRDRRRWQGPTPGPGDMISLSLSRGRWTIGEFFVKLWPPRVGLSRTKGALTFYKGVGNVMRRRLDWMGIDVAREVSPRGAPAGRQAALGTTKRAPSYFF